MTSYIRGMKARYIELSESDQKSLVLLKRKTSNSRVMERCHALLLSAKGYGIEQLRDIFDVRRDTISDWFNRWEAGGIAGLEDSPKPGRPRSFSASEEKKS